VACVTRRKNRLAHLIGALLLIPGLLQTPLPQADFHIIRHRHGSGEVCTQHDHLLRWHPQAGEGEDVAVLHWHWLPPRTLAPSTLDDEGRNIPALHAHDSDIGPLEPSSSSLVLTRDDRGRDEPVIGVVLDWAAAIGNGPIQILKPPRPSSVPTALDGVSAAGARAVLARWNC